MRNMKAFHFCIILFAFTTQSASALQIVQTDAEKLQAVQMENQKLRDDLAAAQKRIKELESGSAKTTTPTPRTPIALDPTAELMGNPIAILDFFQKKFTEDMTKARIPLPNQSDNKSTRQIYLAKSKEWIDLINRTKYPITWRGRITHLDESPGPYQTLEFQCVSADNSINFGRVTSVSILKSNAMQLGTTVPASDVIWTLNATLEPTFNLDPLMLERNTFDNPPLIGPCVTFRYKVTASRLFIEIPAAPDAPTQKK